MATSRWEQYAASLARQQRGAARNLNRLTQKYGESPRVYNVYAKRYGLGRAESQLGGVVRQVGAAESRLKNLEGNVNQRIGGMGLSEAERQRMYTAERKPLSEQYTNLIASQKTAQETYNIARQRVADLMAMRESRIKNQMNAWQAKMDALSSSIPLYKAAYQNEPARIPTAQRRALRQQRATARTASRAYYSPARTSIAARTTSSGSRKTTQSFKNALQSSVRSDLSNILSRLLVGKKKKKSTGGFNW
jgi:hypothetical protein